MAPKNTAAVCALLIFRKWWKIG